ncbi:hypothetical protein GCM10011519_18380 [Marmoricola endophyticus]|uniref:Type IV secretion protein Rhs n=2 Tax=Marmoricola endophyticus TaxID=2040280 RepID=A0A917F2P6_9ACTN|nr:hypothetical protein GCM10011519_18380 [Marmoricola endophyticus]
MGAANALATGCENAASTIRTQCTGRSSATTTAMQDFEGRFSELFQQNQTQANTDGHEIATALGDVAKAVRYLVSIVPEENARRKAAREWKKRHDKDKSEITWSDFGGDEPPPNDGPKSPPPPAVVSANAKDRETPPPGGGGGGGGGTSSARPDKLRDFVTGVSGQIESLHGKPGTLSGLNDDFTNGFDWGTGETTKIDGTSVYNAFRTYNQYNQQDKTWVNTVAGAFEEAGGSGGMVTVSNAALQQSLNAAGVPASRKDIPATSPMLMGIAPTTGYSDDPVNAATGNFVEPETDLVFPGAASELTLTRMYNSFVSAAGAFGTGWVSWPEVRLTFGDESATFTHPDGRASEFPRLGGGWDRALGESLWLARDEQAGELRLTDNDGGTWRFTTSGVPLSHDRGVGTMVSLSHEDGRLVRLDHERGRSIALVWDGERVVAAEGSDGRTVTYSYEDDRLVAVTGDLGTRTYRWNDAGLVEAVVDADGVVEVENTYDDEARVTTQRSPHGRVSRYTYLPGHVTEVADVDGTRANTWIHDGRGRLIGLVDSDGDRQSRAYDEHGNEVVVTERDGSALVREFDDRGHVVREVTPSGSDMSFEYDAQDRLVRATTEDGAETVFSYDNHDRQPSLVVDPEGGETRLQWVNGYLVRLSDPTGVALAFDHDEQGNLVATTSSAGDTARLEYDERGRIVASSTPSGHRTTYVHGPAGLEERCDPDGAVWRYEHTVGGRLSAVVDPTGARSGIEYGADGEGRRFVDELGRATTRHLDDLGNLSSVELPDGSTWRYAYDALSRLTSVSSPEGLTWSQTWNSVTDVVSTTDPLGRQSTTVTDEAAGTVVTTDASGTVTQRFDPLGRPISEDVEGAVELATYDRCGRAVELLDGEGGLTRIERDAAGRAVAVTDPTGLVTRYEYDVCGRRSAVVDPAGNRTTIEYDADSLPVRCTYPTGEVGRTAYDACGRVVSSWTPGVGGTRVRYDPAGRVVEAHDTATGLRRFTYDAAGQLAAATNGNGGVTRYDYDALGRATTITDPLGNVTRREFDSMDRCIAETDPLGRTFRAGYDAGGRQVWQEDASGRRTEWVYDDADRVVEARIDGRTIATHTWDPRGRSVETTDSTRDDGRVVALSSQWNRRGQLVRETRDGVSQAWEYDAAGRRTSMTLADGSSVDYRWDDVSGWLRAVEHPLLGRASFEHDAQGRVVAATAGALIQSWEYADGFVVGHSVTDVDGAVRTVVDRDDEGRILRVDRGGEATTFDYDAARQLIASQTGDAPIRWRYDAAGRVVAESSASGDREFSYDAASQLVSVAGAEGMTRHSYDEAGRRVRTEYADGRVRVLGWAPTGSLESVLDESGGTSNRIRLHVDASGRLSSVDDVPVFWDAADTYAPALVQIGATPVVTTGGLTGIGEQWSAPGWRTSRTYGTDPWSAAGAAVPTLLGLPDGIGVTAAGELRLGDLEWLGARVYDASTRGFLSVDPLDPVTGAGWSGNPYSYAGNDPMHALDPTGLKPVSEADLKEAAKGSWWYRNKDWVVGGVATVAGVALMATGVGGPAGAMLTSFGTDVLIQKATTGSVNYKQSLVSGAFGGAGFIASKGVFIGKAGMFMKNAEKVAVIGKAGTKTKVALGAAEGYSYQVAGGADPLSGKAFGGAAAGTFTAHIGARGDEIAKGVKGNIVSHFDDVASNHRFTGGLYRGFGTAAGHTSSFGIKTGTAAYGAGGGEFIRQVTDGDPGVDYDKIGGKAAGGALSKHMGSGWSSPAGKGISSLIAH